MDEQRDDWTQLSPEDKALLKEAQEREKDRVIAKTRKAAKKLTGAFLGSIKGLSLGQQFRLNETLLKQVEGVLDDFGLEIFAAGMDAGVKLVNGKLAVELNDDEKVAFIQASWRETLTKAISTERKIVLEQIEAAPGKWPVLTRLAGWLRDRMERHPDSVPEAEG